MTERANKTRYNNIVWFRGITSLIVVLGHALSDVISNQTPEVIQGGINHPGLTCQVMIALKTFIYTFHMPLFMSVSGFLFFKEIRKWKECSVAEHANVKDIKGFMSFVTNKFYRLIIPFLLIMYFWRKPILIFIYGWGNPNGSALEKFREYLSFSTTGALWYLYVLFAIFIFQKMFLKLIWRNDKTVVTSLIIFAVTNYVGSFLSGPIHHFMVYNFFFFLGCVIHRFLDKIKERKNLGILLTISSVFTVAIICDSLEFVFLPFPIKNGMNLVIAVADILLAYKLTGGIQEKAVPKKVQFLDNVSMGSYLFHEPIILAILDVNKVVINGLAMTAVCFAAGYVGAVILTMIVRKLHLQFALGER